MTKLYISYYGDSISILEGSFKKNKFIINSTFFMSSSEIELDYRDKYNLLKQALRQTQYKTKKAVLCLNTMDVIVKSTKIPKIDSKDLDGIMEMEIDEMISLERDTYTFSYEVMREVEEHGEQFLDLILAGIESKEVDDILGVFDEFNLKLEYIDILPAAYSRVLKQVEYSDIMIVNTGEYSTSIDIYKEDSLYIHDNVPVKLNNESQLHDYMRLVDEANGLMNYYSSRNFGKIVDTILLIGNQANNKDIIAGFKEIFSSEIIPGIEYLYDIYTDIKGDIKEEDLNKVVENIGCMMRESNKSPYLRMNLLPQIIKNKIEKKHKLNKVIALIPILLIVAYLPVIGLNAMNNKNLKILASTKSEIAEVKIQHKEIDSIEKDIKLKEDEIKIYDMLIKKEPKWDIILTSIDRSIPFKVQLDTLDLSYIDESKDSKDEDSEEESNGYNKESKKESQSNENDDTQLYEKVPNFITITGKGETPSTIGQFVYKIKELPFFDNVKLSGVTEQDSSDNKKSKPSYSFKITAKIKDGVVVSE